MKFVGFYSIVLIRLALVALSFFYWLKSDEKSSFGVVPDVSWEFLVENCVSGF